MCSSLFLDFKAHQSNKVPGSPLTAVHADSQLSGRKSEVSDDEPLYDSVASDEDYIAAEQMAILAQQAANSKFQESKGKSNEVCINIIIKLNIKKASQFLIA